jgi:hypothetical protein
MRCRLLVLLLNLATTSVAAQDRVLLEEVIPALTGTELGSIEIGDAPPPGTSRSVRRSEVIAALRTQGRSADGLAIPRSTRIDRTARTLESDALVELARPALEETLAPCSVTEIRAPRSTTASSRFTVRAEATRPLRNGSIPATLVLESNGRETRVSIRAEVTCPAPDVEPGKRVRIVVRVGNVHATAPGEARQPGRVGDVIRVTNLLNRRSFDARIVDEQTVEVNP